ncbi:uncharacterized protein B0J16DRAFT_388812 [Fusarium flagelliforme]|uniref:uncharacterized protein n=1 Tax=Fusarium flagelliforme TaxID=2675880 RepID=UPI001E8CD9E3|nr:uncharacterized protein B0J16DRAFT_388812 [Fusarium flagelliforme]KAH7174985.1 hypothetical protein B0J16DRAFT_388812 [Fusarium flagelliforme]
MDHASFYSEGNIAAVMMVPHCILSFVATLFVGMRLYTSSYITRSKWTVDEYTSIAALTANHFVLIAEGVAIHFGYGDNIIKVGRDYPNGVSNMLKCVIGLETTYCLAAPLSKMAVLAMYYRIFSQSRFLRYGTWILVTLIASWGFACEIVCIFSCRPIAGYWDKTIPAKCIDSNRFYVGITIPNIIFDILTVALPVREVWNLQMNRDKKWAVTTIFLLGGSVVLASISRLVLFLIFQTSANITQTLIWGDLASTTEICLAIIGACLPPCAPILKRMLAPIIGSSKPDASSGNNTRSKFSAMHAIGQIPTRGKNTTIIETVNELNGSFERLDDSRSLQGSTDGLYVDGHDGVGRKDTKQGKWSQIHVRREVAVESKSEDIPMDTFTLNK